VSFEWDEGKNRENIRKHGFGFGDAWQIFEFPVLDELDARTYYGEERWTGIGLLGNCQTRRACGWSSQYFAHQSHEQFVRSVYCLF
jgi:uncharacterized DUF497 family protein